MAISMIGPATGRSKKMENSPCDMSSDCRIEVSAKQPGAFRLELDERPLPQGFRVELTDVKLIKTISLELAGLVTQGVNVRTGMPEYLYTGLAEVKEEVQALAAEDAMRRARKVAAAAGATLGPIRDARMGVAEPAGS